MTHPLTAELAHLRKGRGLGRPKLIEALGPQLRTLLGVTSRSLDEEVRTRLRYLIADEVWALQPDLRAIASVAYGLTSDRPTLAERFAVSDLLPRPDERTLRRRLVLIDQQLASRLAIRFAGRSLVSSGWHLSRYALHVDVSGSRPVFEDTKTIVAAVDGLAEFDELVSLPAPAEIDDLEVVAGPGCALAGREPLGTRGWRFRYALPYPLIAGDPHQATVRYLWPDRAAIQPFALCIPLRVVDQFEVSVTFGTPCDAWVLSGTLTGALFGEPPADEIVRTTSLAASFAHLSQGLAYGIAWRWPDH